MSASAIAAWVGAFGAVANAVALIWVERRRRKSEAVLTAYVKPAGDSTALDGYGNSNPTTVELKLHTDRPVTIRSAGLVRGGPGRRLRSDWKPASPSARRPGESGVYGHLPASSGDSPWVGITLIVADVLGAELKRDIPYVAWVELASGQRIYAAESLKLRHTDDPVTSPVTNS